MQALAPASEDAWVQIITLGFELEHICGEAPECEDPWMQF